MVFLNSLSTLLKILYGHYLIKYVNDLFLIATLGKKKKKKKMKLIGLIWFKWFKLIGKEEEYPSASANATATTKLQQTQLPNTAT